MENRVYIEGRWPRRLRECDKRDIGSEVAVESLGSLILYLCTREHSSPRDVAYLGCFGDMPCSIIYILVVGVFTLRMAPISAHYSLS